MSERTFGEQVVAFFNALEMPNRLPAGVSILNPYRQKPVREAVEAFYTRYFNDTGRRVFIIGINPGRFGGGATGIAFTDSPALEWCGIRNDIPETRELSADFVCRCIDACGGPEQFYRRFFITSASPVGFVRKGVNFNYYDDPAFRRRITPYMAGMLGRQVRFGARHSAIVLGRGKNYGALSALNDRHAFFKRLFPLDHPRFIMQYRRKKIADYIEQYRRTLEGALAAE